MMKAIILSAGRGARMFPLTEEMPKPLLEISSGLTIIESQLKSLEESGGISEAVFVVGYKAEMIEQKLADFKAFPIRFLYNPFYMQSNNLISLWLACGEMEEDFLVINGDDVFRPVVARRLLDEPQEKEVVMVVDKKDVYSQEDMKVRMVGERITAVSKKIPCGDADGESIGMMRFLGQGRNLMRETLQVMVRSEENKQVFYLKALQQIMDAGFPVHANMCDEKEWTEIDFHPDLDLIRKNAIRFNS